MSGTAPTTVYRYGTNLGADAYGDAFTMDFNLANSYRYFGIRHSTLAAGNTDPEIDAIATRSGDIPEFPTMAIPVIAVIGLMLLFQRRKSE